MGGFVGQNQGGAGGMAEMEDGVAAADAADRADIHVSPFLLTCRVYSCMEVWKASWPNHDDLRKVRSWGVLGSSLLVADPQISQAQPIQVHPMEYAIGHF